MSVRRERAVDAAQVRKAAVVENEITRLCLRNAFRRPEVEYFLRTRARRGLGDSGKHDRGRNHRSEKRRDLFMVHTSPLLLVSPMEMRQSLTDS